MKKFTIILFTLLLSFSLWAQNANDEKEIKDILDKMDQSWAAHDYAYSKLDVFDDNAIVINPVGMVWKNKGEITSALQFLGEVRFKYSKGNKSDITLMRFLSSKVALVVQHNGDEVIQDFKMPDGSPGGHAGDINEGMASYTFVKNGPTWKITSMQITEINSDAVKMVLNH